MDKNIIRKASTPEEIERVKNYLAHKGAASISDHLFYTQNKDKHITAAGGVLQIPMIEPLIGDSIIDKNNLYYYLEGVLKGIGSNWVQVITKDPKTQEVLKKIGYTTWSKDVEQLIKEI